jgi:molecular chaperone GrpE (heat shock protein)
VAAEVETEALRAQVEQLNTEAQEHNRELEARCAELDRRLTDALAELEAVTKAERRAVRETRQFKAKLAKQTAQLDELQASQS